MQLRNDDRRYGAVSIALHWAGAITVLTMLFTALMMALAPDHQAYLPWVKFHASFGMLLWLLIAARIAWHVIERRPRPLSDSVLLGRIARIVHIGLVLLIGMQLLTGPTDVWSGGFPLTVFDFGVVPSPIGHTIDHLHGAIGTLHAYTGLTLGIVLTLHLAGVAKHVLIDRDGTLARMFGMARRLASPAQSDSAPPGTQMP